MRRRGLRLAPAPVHEAAAGGRAGPRSGARGGAPGGPQGVGRRLTLCSEAAP
ncbi:hypothetical protein PUR49_34770 [Streptomyces sp. BE147]|nr:hypothetical protein [Streptomyces sp. BE147]